uniref:Uncharacterized protein n=1 Tax=Ditylenchus dipsaci TaxID=166011 RepID=A0A915D0P2_9BILA
MPKIKIIFELEAEKVAKSLFETKLHAVQQPTNQDDNNLNHKEDASNDQVQLLNDELLRLQTDSQNNCKWKRGED